MGFDTRLHRSVAAALAAMIACVALVTWVLCEGHLIYTLDDPYITLALGLNIGHGHYGLNSGEAASPASSILYPLVLACFAWSSSQDWIPALVNGLAATATGVLLAAIVCHYGIASRRERLLRVIFLVVVLCVALNLVGLVFTGLEHSLHTLTSVAVIFGLALVLEGEPTPQWLVTVLVLAPLWRFEGLALAVAGVAVLLFAGRRRAALLASAAVIVTVGADMAVMSALGLPLLPSSVMVKQTLIATGQPGSSSLLAHVTGALEKVRAGLLGYPPAWLLVLLIPTLLLHPLLRARREPAGRKAPRFSVRQEFVFAGAVVAVLVAHVLFGAWGGGYRYEIYAATAGAAAAIILWHTEIAWFVERGKPWAIAGVAMGLLAINLYYVWATVRSPYASRGIYEQQYQMHRFATEFYRRPVAVNDLGWVSYRNPSYVLDLWGLGSEEARKMRQAHEPDWMAHLAREHHVGLAMVYAQWFAKDIPAGWSQLAVLKTPHRTAASFPVTFYVTSREAFADASAALRKFMPQLPNGDQVTIIEQPEHAALADHFPPLE
jgi:hypothetical protein